MSLYQDQSPRVQRYFRAAALRYAKEPPASYRAVGEALGVSASRAGVMAKQALCMLRHPSRRAMALAAAPHGTPLHRAIFGWDGICHCLRGKEAS